MYDEPSMINACPACGADSMRMLSAPRPQYVEQCRSCRSVFFYFGAAGTVSHNEQYNVDSNYQRYLESANECSVSLRYQETLKRVREMAPAVASPRIFDVGAGGGDFLALARADGFDVAGNEVSQPAIDECWNRHRIELMLGDDLRSFASFDSKYDVVTMWCVIAHVDEPRELLRGVRELLRPGGILFFSTPRYCSIDQTAIILRKLSRDRFRRIFDRRINHFHRRQYSKEGMNQLLRSEGFLPLSIEPTIGYGLRMREYLTSIGVPLQLAKPGGRALESSAKIGILPRNILSVYARAI